MKRLRLFPFLFLFSLSKQVYAQDVATQSLPEPLVLIDQDGFYKVMAAASLSFVLSEFVFKEADLNYFQARASYFDTGEGTRIMAQNFGIEKRLSHWFGIGIETYAQQFREPNDRGMGLGINAYYRWYAFGKKRLSPFLEYGTGGFYGFKPFPADGGKFTFHLTTSVGLEYTLKNENKVRLTYGQLHQSNNGLFESNPGVDANGFTLTYLWRWKKKQ